MAMAMAMATAGGQKKLQLYSIFMGTPSFRVRIALNLKGLDYEYNAINLFKREQHNPEFLKINPMGYVPALVDGDIVVADSLAIILYLEDKYPQHPLLPPRDLEKRAINYQAANIICSSIQPLLSIPILKYVEENVGPDEKLPWIQKHVGKGFAALDKLLKNMLESTQQEMKFTWLICFWLHISLPCYKDTIMT